MEQSSVWVIGIVALAIGAVIGYLMGRSGETDTSAQDALTKQLNDARQELKDYKEEVNSHFAQTADLVNNLTESYREVHQHLASSSQQLCGDAVAVQRLETAAKPELPQEAEKEAEAPVVTDAVASDNVPEPPRDYAPKKADEEGTLSETYGLQEKSEPVPQSPADLKEKATADAEPATATAESASNKA